MSELELSQLFRLGSKGAEVKRIQEWLCLNDINVVVDGDFGPATQAAVKLFQERQGLEIDGIVGPLTFPRLIAPALAAIAEIPDDPRPVEEMIVAYAAQHCQQHPREVGGDNMGPWVRLYMDGHEGPEWLWCAGFACYVLKQAFHTKQMPLPIPSSFSCNSLAIGAKEKGLFVSERDSESRTKILPGSFFLTRKTDSDWTHVGIVEKVEPDYMQTIEGNSFPDGSRGCEVCRRLRNYDYKDFIVFALV